MGNGREETLGASNKSSSSLDIHKFFTLVPVIVILSNHIAQFLQVTYNLENWVGGLMDEDKGIVR